MIPIATRTEYSFNGTFAPLSELPDQPVIGICDTNSCWGHSEFAALAKEKGFKPVYGVEIEVFLVLEKKKKQRGNPMRFIAKNQEGLQELYKLFYTATSQFFYLPRLAHHQAMEVSENILVLHGPFPHRVPNKPNHFAEVRPDGRMIEAHQYIATSSNFWMKSGHDVLAEMRNGRFARANDTYAQYVITEESEHVLHCAQYPNEVIAQAHNTLAEVVNQIDHVELPQAEMIEIKSEVSLREMCMKGLSERFKCNTADLNWKESVENGGQLEASFPTIPEEYIERLDFELEVIAEKGFESYFFVMADLVQWAKKEMIVGPGRGSAAGSLCCYALGITDIDPLEYDLLFERFIDISRSDMPDIDVDFPDVDKPKVQMYLEEKYGKDRVAKVGAVGTLSADGILVNCCKSLGIDIDDPLIQDFKHLDMPFTERFETECGIEALKKYPQLKYMALVEGHKTNATEHAAGIVVTDKPLYHYCAVDANKRCAQIDKVFAEKRGMLKIDALGLSSLTVISNCLKMIDKPYEWLLSYDRSDTEVLSLVKDGRTSGIFQFAGAACRALVKGVNKTDLFDDLVAITSLARPGPLESGGAGNWVRSRNGEQEVTYLHPTHEKYTSDTFSVLIYQEQVMFLANKLAGIPNEEVNELRKGIGKKNQELIDKYESKFVEGCVSAGVDQEEAEHLWETIVTFGGYGFNKSHAVSYAVVSYMMMVLKSKYPEHFACAWLRTFSNKQNDKKQQEVKSFLQELTEEGIEYKPYDAEKSGIDWEVVDGQLIGGLTNIKGIGYAKAEILLHKRKTGKPLTDAEQNLLANGKTAVDDVFHISNTCKKIIDNAKSINITSPITPIKELEFDNGKKTVVLIGQVYEHQVTSMNDPERLARRGYEWKKQDKMMDVRIQDDTGKLLLKAGCFNYVNLRPQLSEITDGCFIVVKGEVGNGFPMLDIQKIKVIDPKWCVIQSDGDKEKAAYVGSTSSD